MPARCINRSDLGHVFLSKCFFSFLTDSSVFLILASVEDVTSASDFHFRLASLSFSSSTACSFSASNVSLQAKNAARMRWRRRKQQPPTSSQALLATRKRQLGSENSEATTWKRQLGSDNSEATTRKRQLGSDNLEATTRKRQFRSDNLEATTWKRQLGSDNSEATTRKRQLGSDN